MFNENASFDYKPPNLYYDKDKGEIKMKDQEGTSKKKILRNSFDLEREK